MPWYCAKWRGGSETVVRARVKMAWNKWRELAGVVNDKQMPRKVKVKLYRTVLRPVLLYGLEACSLTRKEEKILETTEMRILRGIIGVTLRDKERNDEIRKELEVCIITVKAREYRLRLFGHLHGVRMMESQQKKSCLL